MYRAVVLTTLTLLLLAITGITLAREGTITTDGGPRVDVTVQDLATTTMEPTAITREPTDIAEEGSTERSVPVAEGVTEDSTVPEATELEATKEEATGGNAENTGKPESLGKPKSVGGHPVGNGKADDEGEAREGGGQEKVTLCHKGKNTISVGAPAQAAHERHGDTVGPCQTGEAAIEPSEETPGPGVAQDGESGRDNGQQEITLCHKGKTLTVGAPAREAHLRHGDTEGPCAG